MSEAKARIVVALDQASVLLDGIQGSDVSAVMGDGNLRTMAFDNFLGMARESIRAARAALEADDYTPEG